MLSELKLLSNISNANTDTLWAAEVKHNTAASANTSPIMHDTALL